MSKCFVCYTIYTKLIIITIAIIIIFEQKAEDIIQIIGIRFDQLVDVIVDFFIKH